MIDRVKRTLFNRRGASFSFSQAGEDLVLQRIFLGVTDGFYVDVGAYHPYKLSNTYLFYLSGWRGINIEPRPLSRELFIKERPEDINLEIGVAEKAGTAQYYLFEENTLNQFEFTDAAIPQMQARAVAQVRVEPLSKLLSDYLPHGRRIDFITIDTEGAELEVLKSNSWTRFRFKVVLVEHNKKNKKFDQVTTFLLSKGYREAYRIPVNTEADSVFFMAE